MSSSDGPLDALLRAALHHEEERAKYNGKDTEMARYHEDRRNCLLMDAGRFGAALNLRSPSQNGNRHTHLHDPIWWRGAKDAAKYSSELIRGAIAHGGRYNPSIGKGAAFNPEMSAELSNEFSDVARMSDALSAVVNLIANFAVSNIALSDKDAMGCVRETWNTVKWFTELRRE